MSAIEPLYHSIRTTSHKLTKEEHLLLEAELFINLCAELKEIFREEYQEYFHLMKFTTEMENTMLDENLVRLVINDILSSNEYTMEGIAQYTNTHIDVIQEMVSGLNPNPSVTLFRKTMELHRSIRSDLYHLLMKKITEKNNRPTYSTRSHDANPIFHAYDEAHDNTLQCLTGF